MPVYLHTNYFTVVSSMDCICFWPSLDLLKPYLLLCLLQTVQIVERHLSITLRVQPYHWHLNRIPYYQIHAPLIFFGIKIAYAVYNHFYTCFSYPALWTGHQQQRSYQPMFYWNVYKQQSPHARGFPHTWKRIWGLHHRRGMIKTEGILMDLDEVTEAFRGARPRTSLIKD